MKHNVKDKSHATAKQMVLILHRLRDKIHTPQFIPAIKCTDGLHMAASMSCIVHLY